MLVFEEEDKRYEKSEDSLYVKLPSLTLTILLSPSLILVQVMVGNALNMV